MTKLFSCFYLFCVLSINLIAQDTKKVLIIGIDGCRPDALQAAATPNIDGLIPNSIHSYHALNDDITFSGPGWSAMMTGVWSPKHGITDNGFSGSNLGAYPHFFKRVEDYNTNLYTVSISQWHPINNSIVLNHADFKYNAPTQSDVTSEAVNQLSNEDPDVMFLHYDDVDHAGHAHGFSSSVSDYVAAIEGVDTQIGLVLNQLISRPNYSNENWLIFISTDHGGNGTSHGGTSPEEETIFYFANNKYFNSTMITPDTIPVVDASDCINNAKHLSFDGVDDFVDVPHFSELDFGANQDFTIECRVKTTSAGDVAIVGNKDWDSGNNKGFVFSFKFANGPEWKVNIGDGSSRADINTGGSIADNEWHHLAVTFDRDGLMAMYEDGVLLSAQDISNIGDITNGEPLRFGADIDGEFNYSGALEEVRVWDKVVLANEINNWKCTSLNNSHPDYTNLIGYWPLNETSGPTATDESSLNNNGSIVGATWAALDSIVSFQNTPRITDIAISALDHLCIDIEDIWNLDGKSWLSNTYEVTDLNDLTIGSLRYKIQETCPGDTVTFSSALDLSKVKINSGEIILPHTLYIQGNGLSNTLISADFKNRHFNVLGSDSLFLQSLSLIEGFEKMQGGSILNYGMLTLDNVQVSGVIDNIIPKAIKNQGSLNVKNTATVR